MVRVVDFRYHLVSIIAVFLALAVGIVVGTTALNGPVLDDLNGRVGRLSGDKRLLEGQLRTSRGRVADEEQAVRTLAPSVVAGRLAGQRVVLVSTPDAPAGMRDDLVPLLTQAGAEIGASVRLRPALLDPASAPLLDDLVARVAVPGVELPQGSPVDRAVAQVAQVLVRPAGTAASTRGTARRVLAAYQGEDLVEVDGDPDSAGSVAVLLTGDPPPAALGAAADASAAATDSVLGLARALDARSAGVVVAGTGLSAEERGTVRVLRDDNGVSERISSVDAADTPTGRLAVVLALQEQAAGRAGAYGSGPGADAPLPQPSPS